MMIYDLERAPRARRGTLYVSKSFFVSTQQNLENLFFNHSSSCLAIDNAAVSSKGTRRTVAACRSVHKEILWWDSSSALNSFNMLEHDEQRKTIWIKFHCELERKNMPNGIETFPNFSPNIRIIKTTSWSTQYIFLCRFSDKLSSVGPFSVVSTNCSLNSLSAMLIIDWLHRHPIMLSKQVDGWMDRRVKVLLTLATLKKTHSSPKINLVLILKANVCIIHFNGHFRPPLNELPLKSVGQLKATTEKSERRSVRFFTESQRSFSLEIKWLMAC